MSEIGSLWQDSAGHMVVVIGAPVRVDADDDKWETPAMMAHCPCLTNGDSTLVHPPGMAVTLYGDLDELTSGYAFGHVRVHPPVYEAQTAIATHPIETILALPVTADDKTSTVEEYMRGLWLAWLTTFPAHSRGPNPYEVTHGDSGDWRHPIWRTFAGHGILPADTEVSRDREYPANVVAADSIIRECAKAMSLQTFTPWTKP